MARSALHLGAASVALGMLLLPTLGMGDATRPERSTGNASTLEASLDDEAPEERLASTHPSPSASACDGGGVHSSGCGFPSASKTCADMFDACQDIGGKCTKGYPGCDTYGATSCASCVKACKNGSAYPSACKCSSCGFTE